MDKIRKIQFDSNYRDKIVNGDYKVVTKDGYAVEIIRWDLRGRYPIGFIAHYEASDVMGCATKNGVAWLGDGSLNLYIVMPDNEYVSVKYPSLIEELQKVDDETARLIAEVVEVARKLNEENKKEVHDYETDAVPSIFDATSNGRHYHNGYEYVDLGLPSGTLWASCNVGACVPEEYGGYYSWGEISEKTKYKWNNYVFRDSLTKYNAIDGKALLDLKDDVAHVEMGGEWHMPTQAQLKELTDNTTSEWITINGINGRRFTSKANGNSIFIPAAGDKWNSSIDSIGMNCYLWGSSLDSADLNGASGLYFNEYDVEFSSEFSRYRGFSVRGVLY